MMGGNFKRKKMVLYHRWFKIIGIDSKCIRRTEKEKKSIQHKVTRQE